MDLGVRQIRTAGKGSGSIELTLPAELRDLVGLPCRITLRDGSRPDIVLQPDLKRAHHVFAATWDSMAKALLPLEVDVPALPLAAFSFGLRPQAGNPERSFLCWRDGLMLTAEPPHEPGIIARTVAALAQTMAAFLPIDPALAVKFGAACGALIAGVPAAADAEEACDLTATALRSSRSDADRSDAGQSDPGRSDPGAACTAGIGSEAFWHHADPLLAAIADLFADWTNDKAAHATLCAAWRRGRSIEMSGDPAA